MSRPHRSLVGSKSSRTTTKDHVEQSTPDRLRSNNGDITILRERISTWVVVDILELF